MLRAFALNIHSHKDNIHNSLYPTTKAGPLGTARTLGEESTVTLGLGVRKGETQLNVIIFF